MQLVAIRSSPRWPGQEWQLPSTSDVASGSFLFTADAAVAGLVVDHGDGHALVPAATVLAEANRLLDHKPTYVEPTGAFPYGEPTDVAFLRLGFRLAERGAAWSMATHDARLREALLLADEPVTVEQLLGVRPESLAELHGRGVPTRVYLPYGPEWFRYWMRRVAESRGG